MIISTKVLVPNKEWIIESEVGKLGSISKKKKGYDFFRKGQKFEFKSLDELKKELGLDLIESSQTPKTDVESKYMIYDFPCNGKPFNSMYNVKQKLPLYGKRLKSKSLYCAGYYIIKFRKGWVKSFCPKLITLERYPYRGPFKTEQEMKSMLSIINKL